MKQIVGDPLTGQLPRTQLVVPQDVFGPVRKPRTRIDPNEWPRTADPIGTISRQLRPGRVAAVRTRFGVRMWRVRVINTSREVHNKGRHYLVGMSRSGLCHRAWLDQVISVETVQRALASGKLRRKR